MKICQRKKLKAFMGRTPKTMRVFFIYLFLLLFCLRHSEAKGTKETAASHSATPAESQALTGNIKSALTANPWAIYLIYQNSIKGEIASSVEADVLTFTQDTVLSRNLASQGYAKDGSSYRARAGDGGAYVWESIQLHENQNDIVLLKGELKDGVMKGVIVYQPQGVPAKTAIFTTVRPE